MTTDPHTRACQNRALAVVILFGVLVVVGHGLRLGWEFGSSVIDGSYGAYTSEDLE